jgi:hypothetical protein
MSQSPSTTKPGCLTALLSIFKGKSQNPGKPGVTVEYLPADPEETFPYRLRDDFLSPAEKSFYLVLKSMMGEYFTICPKVSLADLFYTADGNKLRFLLKRKTSISRLLQYTSPAPTRTAAPITASVASMWTS